ncbi:hypothetical protein L249_0455 [Ophiocordyceps polyrhachis-furcata BCC 54312]|uniref:FAD synthase n=1 Tax=Ophiocordyceps polyrhachis-furcata BCC 54312 TaxID=1330021 RepID=A0A367LDA3_9HYPO|nr:hypothetical protein L249_0455 [Ophiocordyceps polyrhachis-furcata BCC 54312]
MPQPLANGVSNREPSSSDPALLRPRILAFVDEAADVNHEKAIIKATRIRARQSLAIIGEALQRYRPEELSLSYNGGKDCLVLLILILACLPASAAEPLQAIYIAPPDPFPEVEDFVTVSTARYNLDLVRYTLPMREALEAYRAHRPHVKAVFMGTRRTDPHSEFLTPFSPTDGDWPRFMRVNPVLDWDYPEIWAFIRHLDIPFCTLYNRGFTSLGGMGNTRPNPALVLDSSAKTYRPAYELAHTEEERLGRDR